MDPLPSSNALTGLRGVGAPIAVKAMQAVHTPVKQVGELVELS